MDFNKGLDELKDKGQQHLEDNKDQYIEKGKDFVQEKMSGQSADKNMDADAEHDDTSRAE